MGVTKFRSDGGRQTDGFFFRPKSIFIDKISLFVPNFNKKKLKPKLSLLCEYKVKMCRVPASTHSHTILCATKNHLNTVLKVFFISFLSLCYLFITEKKIFIPIGWFKYRLTELFGETINVFSTNKVKIQTVWTTITVGFYINKLRVNMKLHAYFKKAQGDSKGYQDK
jgi:hypothetical protein